MGGDLAEVDSSAPVTVNNMYQVDISFNTAKPYYVIVISP